MSKINTRSPYFIHYNDALLDNVYMELSVYRTEVGDYPDPPTYILNSSAINNEVTFEISELVRDYIEEVFDGSYVSNNFAVSYWSTKTIAGVVQAAESVVTIMAYDGYGYFPEGANPQLSQDVLQSNTVIVSNDLNAINIPISPITGDVTVNYYSNGVILYSDVISKSTNSTNTIQYSTNSIGDIDLFTSRVLLDGGIVEAKECVKATYDDYYSVIDTDYIEVIVDDTGDIQIYTVKEIEECRYHSYKVVFKNKFGAWQDLWFFKRSDLSLSTKSETYKSNVVTGGSYNTSRHQKSIFNKNGQETLKLNTGFYPEEYNEVFTQLSLSEKVYITYENQTLPINIKTGNITFKNKISDKLINYTIEVEFAFDKINNIR